MQRHTKIYFVFFGYAPGDFVPSELNFRLATEIHHIKNKGMGGTNNPEINHIENIMAVNRKEHDEYGDKKKYLSFLKTSHATFIRTMKPRYKFEYLEEPPEVKVKLMRRKLRNLKAAQP
jgi:hypothetical protein